MTINKATVNLVKKAEGLRLTAYLCPAGKYTVGYGSTFYQDGTRVKKGDTILPSEADPLLQHTLEIFGGQVAANIRVQLNANQFGALVSLAFNIGITRFITSTILKKVNRDPSDKSIDFEFRRWNKCNGRILPGLVNRRRAEADLYFKRIGKAV